MDFIGIARNYHSDLDTRVAEALRAPAGTGSRPHCHAGCAWCCRLVVNATAPEGALAAKYIDENFKTRDKGELIERIKGWLAWYGQGMSHSERVDCPFLVDELCSIYNVRPMGCRVHYSVHAGACMRALQGAPLFYEPPLLEEVLEAVKPLCMEYRRNLEAGGVCFEYCVRPLPELVIAYLKDIDSQP